MNLLHIVVLALVQGITEFLPISSSGHLILVPAVTGWPDQGLAIDVAVHVGTLGAVLLYFHRDVIAMAAGAFSLARGRLDADARLVLMLITATVPIVIAGFLLNMAYPEALRSIEVIGWATLAFGVALYAADRFRPTHWQMPDMRLPDALIIGLAQVLALIPGTSRSGITMTAARALGFDRVAAARFSLLLSIPTILGAGLLQGLDLIKAEDANMSTDALLAGGLAFAAALAAIALLMRWLENATFTPFVAYRMILGIVLLAYAYGFA